jgi:GTP-binding protein Era
MHKAGFVNIVGNPNVGKSTLMNLLVGERISIATFKAQTTRHRIMGILNTEDMQIVFSDTPGVLKPNYKLQESMLNFSESALVDADVLLYRLLKLIVRLQYSRSIREDNLHILRIKNTHNTMASCLSLESRDGDTFPHQQVHQSRFSDIRITYNIHKSGFVHK